VRGFQTKGGEVHEVFTGIIPMLTDATDVFASGTNAPGCLLDKRINPFNAFSYILGKILDFYQFISVTGEYRLQKMHYLVIGELIPAGVVFQ
jgi:hypothetical protein